MYSSKDVFGGFGLHPSYIPKNMLIQRKRLFARNNLKQKIKLSPPESNRQKKLQHWEWICAQKPIFARQAAVDIKINKNELALEALQVTYPKIITTDGKGLSNREF